MRELYVLITEHRRSSVCEVGIGDYASRVSTFYVPSLARDWLSTFISVQLFFVFFTCLFTVNVHINI